MKLTIILNTDIPLSKTLNALAHMTFGLGHRLENNPDINIYFGSTDQVRAFRTRSAVINSANAEGTLFSDFPHTMAGMSTEDLLSNVINTPESEIIYFGACLLTSEMDDQLLELLSNCFILKNNQPHQAEENCGLLPAPEKGNNSTAASPMKISLLLDSRISLEASINNIVLSCLGLGKKIAHSEQRLLNIKGSEKDSYGLTNISFHSLVVVTTGKPYTAMQSKVKDSATIVSCINGPVTIAYDTKVNLEKIITPKSTRLFGNTLKDENLLPANIPLLIENTASVSTVNNPQTFFSSAEVKKEEAPLAEESTALGISNIKLG